MIEGELYRPGQHPGKRTFTAGGSGSRGLIGGRRRGDRFPRTHSYRRSLAKLPGLAPGDLNLAAVIELNV